MSQRTRRRKETEDDPVDAFCIGIESAVEGDLDRAEDAALAALARIRKQRHSRVTLQEDP